ncbi:hypothetical protein [Andreprevotia chitinilytica]|uniref:hypothetical protein n=1 Tax=Andreprevotia chitinilytica TaxID=396808 RepID=UPI0012EB4B41|nr:hypothetical protein [Andreprevotia chitinilytica]
MSHRPYSARPKAGQIFLDLVAHIATRGWYMLSRGDDEADSVLCVSFHVHPDDADRVALLLYSAIEGFSGKTQWVLNRNQHNRFFLTSTKAMSVYEKKKSLADMEREIVTTWPELGQQTATDLLTLSDVVYENFLSSSD